MLILWVLSQNHLHAMERAVVNQINQGAFSWQHLPVEFDRQNAAADAQWILDSDGVLRGAVAERNFEAGPRLGNARVEQQTVALQTKAENPLERHPIEPTGGSGVPGPTAAPDMGRHGI